MTSIERTAYPRLYESKVISKKNLKSCYTLTEEEIEYIKQHIRSNRLRLNFALQLKTCQNLGYFVDLKEIPSIIITHIKKQLACPHNLVPLYQQSRTLFRHRDRIRNYLKLVPWGRKGTESPQKFSVKAAYQAAQTMNNPADIINVIIEELRQNHFELPTFKTLDRIVKHTRSLANRNIFNKIKTGLAGAGLLQSLDKFLVIEV